MPKRDISTLEAIRAYELGDKVQLTDTQRELKEKYEYAFHLLMTHRQMSVVAKKLQEQFGVNSLTTAYSYINAALELYGDPIASKKQALRHINTENQNRLLTLIEAEIALKKRKSEDVTAEIEIASRINERIARLNRLGEDDDLEFDPSLLQRAKVYYIVPDAHMLKEFEDIMDIDVEVLT